MLKRHRRLVCLAAAAATLAMASIAAAAVDPLVRVTGPSPFAAGCEGAPQSGTVYPGAEVEPWVDVNPDNNDNIIGDWQQDRYSNGGARGNMNGFSLDGGDTWTIPPVSPAPDTGQAKFSRCTGGNAANGGDFERATDPWVSFSPNGTAHQVALGINDTNVANAVLTSRSFDEGANWEDPVVVKFDNSATIFNDKETLTADPQDSDLVYVTWQRIVAPSERASSRAAERSPAFKSVAWFAKSEDGGASYEARPIFDPGRFNQTIGNQIVVLPNGDLVMVFNWIRNVRQRANRGFTAAVLRSTDKGETWSRRPIVIDRMLTDGVRDPADGHAVRTGDLIPQIAVDENSGDLYVTWQDDRFTGEEQIAFSRSTNGGVSWSPTQRISKVGGENQAFTATPRVADDGTVAVQHYDFRFDDPDVTPPLTTDTWLLRSEDGGDTWTEERIGETSFDMTNAPDALGYFVGDYAGLDFAPDGTDPLDEGFKPFHVRANDPLDTANRTDVFTTTASRTGP